MDFLETPDARFVGLENYPFAPHFQTVDPCGLRMHHVDEGPPDAPVVLMLHGEPSWSYLYRFMIPPLVAAGFRVVVPDLIGFGKSSKPTRREDYTYARHCAWVRAFIEALDLRNITLFAQDWGSLIGLRLAAEMEPRFARVAIGNGFLPVGELPAGLSAVPNVLAFMAWRAFAAYSPRFVMSEVVSLGTVRTLNAQERQAYDAPFPDARYLAGARAFPGLVPMAPWNVARSANLAAWKVLEKWNKPFLTLFSTGDPITRGLEWVLQLRIPGANGQPHYRVRGGHFLQEDAGAELASRLVAFMGAEQPAANGSNTAA